MIYLARNNAAKLSLKPPHVAFVHCSLIEPLPVKSQSIDCVLSNCVVNLLPQSGRAALLKEVQRVLRPEGRIVLNEVCTHFEEYVLIIHRLVSADRCQKISAR